MHKMSFGLLALVFAFASAASAQDLKGLTVKVEVAMHRNTDVMATYPNLTRGIIADYEFGEWVVAGRFRSGRLNDRNVASDGEMAIRLEHAVWKGIFVHGGYTGFPSGNRGAGAGLLYIVPPIFSTRDGSLIFPGIVSGAVLHQYQNNISLSGPETGLSLRRKHGRISYGADTEFYPWLSWKNRTSSWLEQKAQAREWREGGGLGIRYGGTLGVSVYKKVGVEGALDVAQVFGLSGDYTRPSRRLNLGVRAVYKF